MAHRNALAHVTVALVAVGLAACGTTPSPDVGDAGIDASNHNDAPTRDTTLPDVPTLPPIAIDAGAWGIADPSVTVDSTGHRWMSFRALGPSSVLPNASVGETHLGDSRDGVAWTDQGVLDPADVDASAGGNVSRGPSTLVQDTYASADAGSSVWHLFSDRMFVTAADPIGLSHHWIEHRTASAPLPLAAWNPAVKLFAGSNYSSSDDAVGGPPLVRVDLLHPDLANCAIAREPGALAAPEGLYVSLSCEGATPGTGSVVLLRWSRATSVWGYVATLIRDSEAIALGHPHIGDTDLTREGSDVYLLTSPKLPDGTDWGCAVFWIQDLPTGTLWHDDGLPGTVFSNRITPSTWSGACGYLSGVGGRLMFTVDTGTTHPVESIVPTVERLPAM